MRLPGARIEAPFAQDGAGVWIGVGEGRRGPYGSAIVDFGFRT